jgi:diguanylate cyclase (GGDEF)-like protein/PAS domain S-box-containing protein
MRWWWPLLPDIREDTDANLLRRFVEASRRAEIVALVNSAEDEDDLGAVVASELSAALEGEVAFVLTARGGVPHVAGAVGLTAAQAAALGEDPGCLAALRGTAPDAPPVVVPGGVLGELRAEHVALAPFFADEGSALLGVARLVGEPFDEPEVALLEAVAKSTGHALRRCWLARDGRAAQAALGESEARFRLLAENATDWIARHDLDGTYVYCSPACRTVTGFDPEELLGRSPYELFHPDEVDNAKRVFARAVRQDDEVLLVHRFRRRDGAYAWLETSARRVRQPDGDAIIEVQSATRDVTARVHAEEGLRLESEITATMAEGVCVIRARDTTVIYANPTFESMFGYEAGELLGEPLEVLDGARSAGAHHGAAGVVRRLARRGAGTGEVNPSRKDGTGFWCRVNVSTFEHLEHGTLWVALHVDITEQKRYEATLQHMADHEPLTDLYNRRRFEDELERELAVAGRDGTQAALLALDLDNFKSVNDTLGHSAGDALIVQVAWLLRHRLRRTDVIARLGGDEFAVLLRRADRETACSVADALLGALRTEARVDLPRRVTASVGVALFDTGDDPRPEELLKRADIAMYDAKDRGGDCIAVYDVEAPRHARMEARLDWAERIRHALADDGFVMHVQPILGLAGDDERPRHELLLRMREPGGGLALPGAFLDSAERFGLIEDIDRWVVRRAIAVLAGEQRAGHDVCLQLNISAMSLARLTLVELVEDEVRRTGVDPRGLVFEITETAAIGNLRSARAFAARLAALGCGLALDDFGSGFASFGSLKHLDFDYLKIDGEFVRELIDDPTDRLVVESVAQIARSLGKQTIAEFVGDAPTLALLRELGIDYAQGFHIGKPTPLEELVLSAPVGVAGTDPG